MPMSIIAGSLTAHMFQEKHSSNTDVLKMGKLLLFVSVWGPFVTIVCFSFFPVHTFLPVLSIGCMLMFSYLSWIFFLFS